MNRRDFLGSAAAAVGQLRGASSGFRAVMRSGTGRAFSWRDVWRRVGVQDAVVSPADGAVALHTTRPFSAGGEFFGPPSTLFDPRGELWLLTWQLEDPELLPSLAGGAWSPCFSPDGKRLCVLTLVAPGRVGMGIWTRGEQRWRIFSHLNVDIMLPRMRTASSDCAAPSPYVEIPRRYIWRDERSLVVVDHGEPQQLLLAMSGLTAIERELRQRSEDGDRSVRVWDKRSPTCGAGARLLRVDADTGRIDTLYEGDVRGASLSPDGRFMAVLVATRNIAPAPNRPMQWPLRSLTALDDALVGVKLALVDLDGEHASRDINGVSAVGVVAPCRLPRWSADSARVAIPVRTTYSDAPVSGSDATWEVTASTGECQEWRASSALDAELLAALLTADGLNTRHVIDRRPQAVGQADYSSVGQINGGAWRCGGGVVMLWLAPTITLISARNTYELPGRFVSVQPPAWKGSEGRFLSVREDHVAFMLSLTAAGVRMNVIDTPVNAQLLAVNPITGSAVFAKDGDDGTLLFLARPGSHPASSSLRFNTYFRHVRAPQRRMLTCRFRGGDSRSGLLLLPTDHRSGDRHPVVVWAYPNSVPSMNDPLTQPNSYVSVVYPIQYLLTKGFAVFQAPFPIGGRNSHEPLKAAVDAVIPWLDVLSNQPEVIPGEFGAFGHSNAGYVALALEALTRRFKAVVAWDTFPELGYNTLHANRDDRALDCAGNLVQGFRMFYEAHRQPYAPKPAPPWINAWRYIRNDPLFYLGQATTPLLLVEGEFDVAPQEMEEVYSILYGKGIPVELAYYWGEGHVFGSPGNIQDSWVRTEQFFRRYLKVR